MQLIFKIVLSFAIILAATAIGKKLPSAAGLVSVMPLPEPSAAGSVAG
jgi:hypothetical protein